MIEKRRAEQSKDGMLLLKTRYERTKVMPIYRGELSQEGRLTPRGESTPLSPKGGVDPPIPPKNPSAVQGRTVSPAGHERSKDPSTPSFLINNIIISKQDVGALRPFFAIAMLSAGYSEALRGMLRGRIPFAPQSGINFRPPDARISTMC